MVIKAVELGLVIIGCALILLSIYKEVSGEPSFETFVTGSLLILVATARGRCREEE